LRWGWFDAERVRTLARGDAVLVMDRGSGRWLTLLGDVAPLLPLLAAPDRALTSAVGERVRSRKCRAVNLGQVADAKSGAREAQRDGHRGRCRRRLDFSVGSRCS
jgi:hypothetical protein